MPGRGSNADVRHPLRKWGGAWGGGVLRLAAARIGRPGCAPLGSRASGTGLGASLAAALAPTYATYASATTTAWPGVRTVAAAALTAATVAAATVADAIVAASTVAAATVAAVALAVAPAAATTLAAAATVAAAAGAVATH